MTLPDIDDHLEARAAAFTKEILARMIDEPVEFVDGFRTSWLDASAGHDLMVAISKALARSGTHGLRVVIEHARSGLKEADVALRQLAVELIDSGTPRPVFLDVYLADAHILPVGSRRRGPKRQTNFVRDMAILVLIILVSEKFGLKPTRAYGLTKRPCGCSIVADVLSEARSAGAIEFQAPTEQAVAAIWKRYSAIACPNGLLPQST
jgi:hypothetical protein